MRRWSWILAAALSVGSVLTGSTAVADEKHEKGHDEKVLSLDQIPAPARTTILREAAGAPVVKVEQETRGGQVVYEGEVRKGDDRIGVVVDASGKLIDKHSEKTEKGEKK